uniref:Salivary lipocalin n=1 Tax=Triatoma infestans TaxID=30076 RepID=A6YPH8_TRIIF|nr:salivary lipocalin [Triatoma infestans]
MKTIITVIFAGILTYTDAQTTGCQLPSGLRSIGREFQTNNFFTGSWYVTHMKDATNAYDAVCREYKTNVENNNINLEAIGDYTINGNKKPYTTTCSSVISPIPYGTIRLSCRHNSLEGDTVIDYFFDLLLTIIETNYRDYALAYRCTSFQDRSVHTGNLVLLQRTETADGSKATAGLKKNNLKLTDFQNLC